MLPTVARCPAPGAHAHRDPRHGLDGEQLIFWSANDASRLAVCLLTQECVSPLAQMASRRPQDLTSSALYAGLCARPLCIPGEHPGGLHNGPRDRLHNDRCPG